MLFRFQTGSLKKHLVNTKMFAFYNTVIIAKVCTGAIFVLYFQEKVKVIGNYYILLYYYYNSILLPVTLTYCTCVTVQ